ncbi:MAG: phage baseplate protein, partial [Cetobacterium sp.]
MKFKNFCPFPINSVFILLDNSNPTTLFPGTTWQKQEGRFLQGTSGSESAGGTGGASTVTLTT